MPRLRLRTLSAFAVAALTMVAVGCAGSGDRGGTPGASAQRGEARFANSCAQCHGTDLGGTDQGPPLIHEYYVPSHHADAAFVRAVQQGVQPHHWDFGEMPPVPALSVEEIDDIIAYVRQQQREAGLIP